VRVWPEVSKELFDDPALNTGNITFYDFHKFQSRSFLFGDDAEEWERSFPGLSSPPGSKRRFAAKPAGLMAP
jgi:hypothetical protein